MDAPTFPVRRRRVLRTRVVAAANYEGRKVGTRPAAPDNRERHCPKRGKAESRGYARDSEARYPH
jgi:hypothetical protein